MDNREIDVKPTGETQVNPLNWLETKAQAEREREEAKKEKQQERIRAFNEVAATEAGLEVFQTIMELSGFKKPSTVVDTTGAPSFHGTLYNDARRGLYLQIREFLKAHNLNRVEQEA